MKVIFKSIMVKLGRSSHILGVPWIFVLLYGLYGLTDHIFLVELWCMGMLCWSLADTRIWFTLVAYLTPQAVYEYLQFSGCLRLTVAEMVSSIIVGVYASGIGWSEFCCQMDSRADGSDSEWDASTELHWLPRTWTTTTHHKETAGRPVRNHGLQYLLSSKAFLKTLFSLWGQTFYGAIDWWFGYDVFH